jgi:hypothetical protein
MKKAVLAAALVMSIAISISATAYAIESVVERAPVRVITTPPAVPTNFEIKNISFSYITSGSSRTIRNADFISVDITIRNNGSRERLYNLDVYPSDAAGNRNLNPYGEVLPNVRVIRNLNGNSETVVNYQATFAHSPTSTYTLTVKLESLERVAGRNTWSTSIKRTASITDTALHARTTVTPVYDRIDAGDLIPPVR